ncbi:peptidoglycan-binding protein [Micromonospora sp. LOL_014]|uniref:peptidoglycan-binding domain-containing protein n=1 Tax=Micromonospora sp. LOL_014 TaxID=3345415 RepID=UPI003A85AFC6
MVTAVPVSVGDRVGIGDVLVEVSGRPLILLPGKFPAYRQLVRGDTGPDVRQLQTALRQLYGTPVNGRLDERTETDIRRLYAAAGYPPPLAEQPAQPPADPSDPPPSDPPPPALLLPADELIFLPDVPASVGALPAKVGDNGSGPLVSLTSGGWQIAVPLSPELERILTDLPSQAQFRLDGPGGAPLTTPDVRSSVTPFDTRQQEGASGDIPAEATADYDQRMAVFTLPEPPDGAQIGHGRQIVLERGRSPDDDPVIPASALWTRTDGSVSVSMIDRGEVVHLEVEVLLSVDGRAAVRPITGNLPVGAEVVVAATRDGRQRSD